MNIRTNHRTGQKTITATKQELETLRRAQAILSDLSRNVDDEAESRLCDGVVACETALDILEPKETT